MAVKTPVQLTNTLTANITDPLNKQNTAARVREIIQDIIDSMLNSTVTSLAITNNRIPKGTGTGINDGTWSFSTNDLLPVTTLSNLGGTSNRIGIGYINTLNYSTDLVFSEAGSEKGRFKTGGWFNIGVDSNAARLVVQGSGSTSATFTAKYQNSSNALSLQVRDDGSVYNLGAGSVSFNLAFGIGALVSNTTGNAHVALGYNALNANTTGIDNIAIGYNAMLVNTTGANNTAVGISSLSSNISGGSNCAFGYLTLVNNTASYNNAFGYQSLQLNTSGTENVGYGGATLTANTTGSYNTALGSAAGGSKGATTSNGLFLGYTAGRYETASNKVFLDTIDRSSETNGRNLSLMYGKTDASVANQFLVLNGKLYLQDTATSNYYSIVLTSGALVLTDTGSSNAPS